MPLEVHTAVEPVTVDLVVQQRRPFFGLIALAAFLLSSLIALYLDVSHPLVHEAPGGFSTERALQHLAIIASKPHPLGSPQHDLVRDYILQTLAGSGYSPSVQNTTATGKQGGTAGNVENIVARLDGTEGGKALLLVAHYDSMPWGAGAADDSAAVAALLEVAHILKSRPPLKRTIMFLFSDGEEDGLLGARAFTVKHLWARDVGIVLNFEARGSRGPVIMFETSNRNGWLLGNFARASSRPVANSLAYEVYKRLPNDTDLTVFKAAGYSGMNFAFIDGLSNYHTALDSITNLDPASLQYHGEYALELAEQFGSTTADDPRTGNAIYFDVLSRQLIRYSYPVALFLLLAAGAALASVLFLAFSKHNPRRKLLWGVGTVILAAAGSGLGAALIAWLISIIAVGVPQVRVGELYHPGLLIAAFSIVGLGLASVIYTVARRWVDSLNVTVGAMFVWFVLALITTFVLPGASFIFLWPLLFSLAGWLTVLNLDNYSRTSGKVILTITALPGVLLLVPLLHQIVTGLSLGSNTVVSVMLALLMALVAWTIGPDMMFRRWLTPALLTAGGLVFLLGAVAVSFSDKNEPKQDSLFYGLNSDTGRQMWVSYDDRPDQWSAQFFAKGLTHAALPDFFPGNSRKLLQAPADLPLVPAPTLDVLEDKKTAGGRYLRLRLNSGRHSPVLWVNISPASSVQNLTVNGMPSELFRLNSEVGTMHYYGLPKDGMEMAFEVSAPGAVDLKIEDISYGLVEEVRGSFQPRPAENISYPARLNDTKIVMKSFSL